MSWKPVYIPNKEESAEFSRAFAKKAKFLVDESLGKEVAELLKRSGWNTKYVGEIGLQGRDDEEVIAFAHREDRVLLTHDRDYLDERKFPEHRNPGVVILPGAQGDIVSLIEGLQLMLSIVGEFREVWRRSKIIIDSAGIFTAINRDFKTGAIEATRYRLSSDGGVEMWKENN